MSNTILLVIFMIGLFVGLPVALLLARDRLGRPSRKKLEKIVKSLDKEEAQQ